jgi:hypothetical protein
MDASRRRFLRVGATGVACAIAGCVGSQSGGSSRTVGTTNGTKRSEATTADRAVALSTSQSVEGQSLAVRSATVRDSVFYWPYPDAAGVTTPEGRRYVFVEVVSGSNSPPTLRFSLLTDRNSYLGGIDVDRGAQRLGELYDPESGKGWLGFSVPAPLETERLAVEVDDRVWQLPGKLADRLADPKPTYELREFSVPDAIEAGSALELGATFRNVGDAAGTLRYLFGASGGGYPCCVSDYAVVDVPSGESVDVTGSFSKTREDPATDRIGVKVEWSTGSESGSVGVYGTS